MDGEFSNHRGFAYFCPVKSKACGRHTFPLKGATIRLRYKPYLHLKKFLVKSYIWLALSDFVFTHIHRDIRMKNLLTVSIGNIHRHHDIPLLRPVNRRPI